MPTASPTAALSSMPEDILYNDDTVGLPRTLAELFLESSCDWRNRLQTTLVMRRADILNVVGTASEDAPHRLNPPSTVAAVVEKLLKSSSLSVFLPSQIGQIGGYFAPERALSAANQPRAIRRLDSTNATLHSTFTFAAAVFGRRHGVAVQQYSF